MNRLIHLKVQLDMEYMRKIAGSLSYKQYNAWVCMRSDDFLIFHMFMGYCAIVLILFTVVYSNSSPYE